MKSSWRIAVVLVCLLIGWTSPGTRTAAQQSESISRLQPEPIVAPDLHNPVGVNDFRLSDMGNTDGNAAYVGRDAAIAYNSTNDEYLVVWRGTDQGGGLAAGEFEVFGQRIDATTGAELGTNDFRISDMGPDGNPGYGVVEKPAVAYDSTTNQYLVVWVADDNTAPLVDDELEAFGQRIDGATGQEIGLNDFRISDMGPDGNSAFGVVGPPSVSAGGGDYFVVWAGDDNTGTLVNDEFEIFAQLIDNQTGAELPPNDLRISDMGPDGFTTFGAFTPHVSVGDDIRYTMVAWSGDNAVDGKFEIFAQVLSVNFTTLEESGSDTQVSSTSTPADPSRDALTPHVGYAPEDSFLIAWVADAPAFGLADDEFEVFGQLLYKVGGPIWPALRISNMGTDGDSTIDAQPPTITYNAENEFWLIAWSADDDAGALVEDEHEIFGQLIDASGNRTNIAQAQLFGENGFRISDAGTDGDATRDAGAPAVAFGSSACEYMAVWHADDDGAGSPPLADDELEVFGQRMSAVSYMVLDTYGGVHSYCGAQPVPLTPYFGFPVARDLELATSGFYVLDGFGGIHPGGGSPVLSPGTPYFGFDVARDLELAATGFYVLDGFGGVHAGGGAGPINPATPYFGFDITQDIELVPGGYYVLDGYGGVHGGGTAPVLSGWPYFGFDIARDMELAAVGFYVLDGMGIVHAGGGAPAVTGLPNWGSDLAVDLELFELTRTTASGPGVQVLSGYGAIHAPVDYGWVLKPGPPQFPIFAAADVEFR